MSDKPISVGDLVMVTKPLSCGHGSGLGHVGKVKKIKGESGAASCKVCDAFDTPGALVAQLDTGDAFMLYRLKKIPPLTEPKHVHTIEELTA
jgi:hypothetical protein